MKVSKRVKTSFQKDLPLSKIQSHHSSNIKALMKLSVITQFFPPDYAATGQLIEELSNYLGFEGVDIEVFTGQPGYAFGDSNAPAREQLGRVQVQRTRATNIWYQRIRGKTLGGVLFTIRAMLHLLRHGPRYNVLLLTTAPPFLPIIGYLFSILYRLPYVCILYDLYPDIAIALGVVQNNHWVARFWQNINKRIWQKASGIVVLSPAMKDRVTAICPEVGDKISVIHSWGNPDSIKPIAKKDNWFAQKYNITNKFTVLYSGNMGRCHDVKTILETAKLLKDESILFLCIGAGAKRKDLIKEVENLKLDNFLFLPYQDKEILPYSLNACDLSLVSVDRGFESLVAPSKLYPALATGRPVAIICPQASYLKQLIADGKCGNTFENGDSDGLAKFIHTLSQDKDLAQKMGFRARNYMKSHFTSKVITKQYLEVLCQAVNELPC